MTTLLRVICLLSVLSAGSGCVGNAGENSYHSQAHYSVLAASSNQLDLSVRWFLSTPGLGGISDFKWADPSTQQELIIAGTKAVIL